MRYITIIRNKGPMDWRSNELLLLAQWLRFLFIRSGYYLWIPIREFTSLFPSLIFSFIFIDDATKDDLVQRQLWVKSNMESYVSEMRRESKRRRWAEFIQLQFLFQNKLRWHLFYLVMQVIPSGRGRKRLSKWSSFTVVTCNLSVDLKRMYSLFFFIYEVQLFRWGTQNNT